ncbi:MAG: hypothetical protein IKL68_04115 [Clostridia bacterium]|nr:hypothetical protein [Clostridia bacterium]
MEKVKEKKLTIRKIILLWGFFIILSPIIGCILQLVFSTVCYAGASVMSLWDEDVKQDMQSIEWNIFNKDEIKVVESKKISMYKGVMVFRIPGNRAGSFLGIFLTDYERKATPNSISAVHHEYGHNIQQLLIGPINYLLYIGLPSWRQWSERSYYDRPWEVTAESFGGVRTRQHEADALKRGNNYLLTTLFGRTIIILISTG